MDKSMYTYIHYYYDRYDDLPIEVTKVILKVSCVSNHFLW